MSLDRARFDRRTMLAAALATGGGAILAAASRGDRAGAAMAQFAARTKPAGSDLGAIEHVVFLMQENRSFDHYYGSYPGVRGFDDHPKGKLGNFAQAWPGGRDDTLLPFHLDTSSGIGECTNDLDHSWPAEHMSWANGTNKAFVSTHVETAYQGPEHGVLTMGYYRRAGPPLLLRAGRRLHLCDNYHCSVLGPTHPNRLMALSGTVDPTGAAGGPVLITNGSSDAVWSVHWDTMPEVLEDAGRELEGLQPDGHPLHAGDLPEVRHPQRRHPPVLQPVQGPDVGAVPEGVHAAVPERLRQRHSSGNAARSQLDHPAPRLRRAPVVAARPR